MKRFFSFFLILVVLIGVTATGCATDNAASFFDYFEENTLPDWPAWIAETTDKEILLLGEHHGIADNQDLYLDILRKIPDPHIQLVMELPPSFAYVCNHYIRTGDENSLKQAIAHFQGTFGFAQENLAFWQQIKQMADNGRQIDLIGIDQEFQLKNTALALTILDADRFAPVLERIQTAGEQGSEALLQELSAIVEEHKDLPVASEEDRVVQGIMRSLAQLLENPAGQKSRDEPLSHTFAETVKPGVRVLGIFGGKHVAKTDENPTMVSQLMKDDRFRNNIVVAQLFYVDSLYMNPSSGEATPVQGFTSDSILVQHAKKQKEKTVLYRLPASPLFDDPNVKGLSLPALYDYAFVLKNAQASTPFDPAQ